MKKILSTPIGQILSASIVFSTAFALLYFSPLNMLHGRSDAPIIVGIFGVIALAIAYIFKLQLLTLVASFGYIIAFAMGFIFQTDGVDPISGGTNNLWQIWLISYWVFLVLGLIVNIILKNKK